MAAKKRIVVLGGNGMLGHMVWTLFETWGYDVFPSYRNQDCATAQHPNAFKFTVTDVNPDLDVIPECDYIINCIGAIPQRTPTQPQMLHVNCALPLRLAERFADTDTRVIHVTTDCVFSGRLGWYAEDDEKDAEDWYGTSKANGEPSDVMCIRTSIIGPEHDGRGTNILEWTKKQAGKLVRGYTNHYWNGVTTKELAKVFRKVIEDGKYRTGTYHVFSREKLSKYSMICAFNDKYKLDIDVRPYKTPMLVDRTLRTIHDLCDELQIPTFGEMLDELD